MDYNKNMKLEYENPEEVKRQILNIISKHIHLSSYQVFFFGSRVSGKSDEWSDIDVGIEGAEPLPRGVLSGIKDEIEELPVLYKIDVVDFADVNDKFKILAKQQTERVN